MYDILKTLTAPAPQSAAKAVVALPKNIATAPLAVAVRAMDAQKITQRRALGVAKSATILAGAMAMNPNAQTWKDLADMQEGILERTKKICFQWIEGCNSVMAEYGQVRHATTLSKLMESQYNVFGQCFMLFANQMTSIAELHENIDYDFSYWVHEKLTGDPNADA